MNEAHSYCLDANVLIQAWDGYYSPRLCPTYWEVLNRLGKQGLIFIPAAVYQEITRTEDKLSAWLKGSSIRVHKQDGRIGELVKKVFAADPNHQFLVDNQKGRSLADPWIIAHAMAANACVVTKEQMMLAPGKNKIKIPNVCQKMGIKCINDFQFAEEVGIRFVCDTLPGDQAP